MLYLTVWDVEPVVTQTSWLEAQVYVKQPWDLEDHLPQKKQLLLKLLGKMLQLLQKPVMIHLTGLWLAIDGRATLDSIVV